MNKISAHKTTIDTAEAIMNASLEDLLTYDPLDHAEKIYAGIFVPYKDIISLSMVLRATVSGRKEILLKEMGDSGFTNKLDDYIRIVSLLGFKEVAKFSFTGTSYDLKPGPQETFYIFAHDDGIILSFDTYRGTDLNGGHFYYNWKPNERGKHFGATSSGGYTLEGEKIWVGYHDCREAIVYKIANLRNNGTFVKPWVENPFLWLVGYGEYSRDSHSEEAMTITKERINLLPDWVKREQ